MVESFVAIKNEGFPVTWGNLITLKMSRKHMFSHTLKMY